MVQGKELDGAGLAALVRKVVAALNTREIPTAGSLVEYFNRELVGACRDQFVARWVVLVNMCLRVCFAQEGGAGRHARALLFCVTSMHVGLRQWRHKSNRC